jgi:2-methylaconitate cis-trans-isomerase PrpF
MSPFTTYARQTHCAPFLQSRTRSFHVSSRFGKQQSFPAAYYRGGTSRAVIFKKQDLPSEEKWPSIFRGVINSPDPNGRQLDGMGGGVSSLSKVCVVGLSKRADADVDYTFAAIGVKMPEVDLSSNCGNMSSAIGPFAVNAGLVKKEDGPCTVRIHNTNTGKIIHSKFDVEDGEARVGGSFAIDGVAGTGAKIELAFIDPAGSKTGKILPTGNAVDTFDGLRVTCVDVGNPCVFVHASSLGVKGGILADAIDAHPDLLSQLDSIRRQAAVAMGISKSLDAVPGSIPKVAMVAAPYTHELMSGETVEEKDCDMLVRAISVGQPHRAVPITVAMALAVASRIEGSVVKEVTSLRPVDADGVTIGHNSGKLLVSANFDDAGAVKHATIFRTARRIMEGTVYTN